MNESPWICRHCFTGNDSVSLVCQGCKRVRSSLSEEPSESEHHNQEPREWLSAIRGLFAALAGAILGIQLVGSEPHLLTWRSSPSPVHLSSWLLSILGLTAVLASVVVAADILASDLKAIRMPAFMQGKRWRAVVKLIWLTFLVLITVFLVSQANVTPALPQ